MNLSLFNTFLGRGKRRKQPNRLYNNFQFWRHNDSDDENVD